MWHESYLRMYESTGKLIVDTDRQTSASMWYVNKQVPENEKKGRRGRHDHFCDHSGCRPRVLRIHNPELPHLEAEDQWTSSGP